MSIIFQRGKNGRQREDSDIYDTTKYKKDLKKITEIWNSDELDNRLQSLLGKHLPFNQ